MRVIGHLKGPYLVILKRVVAFMYK